MTTRLFNGTTVTFNSTEVGKLVGLALRVGGEWQNVTEPEDANRLYELSPQPDFALQLKFKGCHSLEEGAKGTLAIAFSNGFTRTLPGTWQVGNTDISGDQDSPWQSSIEARPTVPDVGGGS